MKIEAGFLNLSDERHGLRDFMYLYIDQIAEPLLVQTYFALFLVSFFICLVIILSSGYGFSRRVILDETAIQSAHSGFVPRVGGLAIYISLIGLIPLLSFGFIPLAVVFDLNTNELTWLILSASPVFVMGLAEDLGYDMSPRIRLMASAISGLVALLIFKVWLSKLGLPILDHLLLFTPFAILFTVFATVGVVNAFNLIDGLNGLSSYESISVAISLSIIAFQVSNVQFTIFFVLLSAAVLGFLVLNFPLGKIFLGDGGAYALGHLLVWSAILLLNRTSEISPFAILLIFYWPVADTGLAIWRRWKLGTPTDRPDRLHFHQLTMRFLEIRFFGRNKRYLVNPISTIVLLPFISTPQVLGVLYWTDLKVTIICTCLVTLAFTVTYFLGINSAKKARQ